VYAPDCDGLNASFVNAGPAAQTYAWDFGDGSSSALPAPSHNYVNPGQGYLVQLIASNGACSSKDTMTTDKFDLAHQLVIPNIFTPNGDNTNDCFEIGVNNVYAGNLLNCGTIDIFNRWGLKVFSGSLSKCWNGLKDNSGNALPDGTYYYIIDNKQQQNRGFITLAR
jgi:gliding motility-associated-like protein